MERQEYLQELKRFELEAKSQPESYRRKVLAFVWLGHAVFLLGLVSGVILIALGIYWLLLGAWLPLVPVAVLVGGLLLWNIWHTTRRDKMPEPGVELLPEDAPELFRLIDKIRRRLQGPGLDAVFLTTDYNAYINQRRRWGVVGPTRNVLAIGLPLLMALDRNRLTAVLAHEYAHLRSGDGSLMAFLYRDRITWHRLTCNETDQAPPPSVPATRLSRAWLDWYTPRLLARSFALARQEEFLADRLAGEQVGMDTHAGALMEVHLRQTQMTHRFWTAFWAQASEAVSPPMYPWAWAMAGNVPAPSRLDLQTALVDIRTEPTHHDDTHPPTRDRVTALGGDLRFPGLSREGSMAMLGDTAVAKAVTQFDDLWWQRHRDDWKAAHERAQGDLVWIADQQSCLDTLDVPALMRLAQAIVRLKSRRDARSVYMAVLRLQPDHAEACWQLALEGAERQDFTTLDKLEALSKAHPDRAHAAAKLALSLLERAKDMPDQADTRRQWELRLEQADALEHAAQAEVAGDRLLDKVTAHDLDEHELAALAEAASRIPQVKALFVMRRPLRTFSARRCHVAVVSFRSSRVLPPLSPEAVLSRLPMPGLCWAVDRDEVETPTTGMPSLPLGEAVYHRQRRPSQR